MLVKIDNVNAVFSLMYSHMHESTFKVGLCTFHVQLQWWLEIFALFVI